MQYKKVEKIIENGKHKLLYDGIFVENDPDYYEPEVEPEISEERLQEIINDIFVDIDDEDEGESTFQKDFSSEDLDDMFVDIDEDGTPIDDYDRRILSSIGDGEYFGMSPEEHEEQLRKQKKEQDLPHKLRMDVSDSEIVRLKDEQNLTLREIAKHLHCSPNTVRNRYNKAKGIK